MKETPISLPLVSIVIPVYNGGYYLQQAITSVLNQTYKNIELIVIDDGSLDNTLEIIKSYEKQFYWESQANCGQSATLNKGWTIAKGEFLSYLSADDTLEKDAIEVSVNYLLAHPDIILTYPDYGLIDSFGKLVKRVHAPEFDYTQLLTQGIVQPGPGVVFRSSGYKKIGGWDTSLRQMPDYDYWLRLGLLGEFKRIPRTLASFRVHADSQTYAPSSIEKSEECLRVITKYFANPELPQKWHALRNLAFSHAHIITARLHIRAGRNSLAFTHFWQAVRQDKRILLSARAMKLLLNGLKHRAVIRLSALSKF